MSERLIRINALIKRAKEEENLLINHSINKETPFGGIYEDEETLADYDIHRAILDGLYHRIGELMVNNG